MNIEIRDILQGALLLGTMTTIALGIVQYRTAQHWKKKELAATEARAFLDDPMVLAAQQMLNWSAIYIHVPPSEPGSSYRRVFVTPDFLTAALSYGGGGRYASNEINVKMMGEVEGRFNADELYIRVVFDRLLDVIDRFEKHVASGLLSVGDVKPYLDYNFEIISGKRANQMDSGARKALIRYMNTYGYENVLELMRQCGHPAKVG